MAVDTVTALTAAELAVVSVSVVYLARQLRGERIATGFQAYAQVSDSYMRHLSVATDDSRLNCVWEPLEPERRGALDDAQAERRWGAWYAMTLQEKACYRYTRTALEICEQAWEVRRRGMIAADTWAKWEQWISIWVETRYFDYVFEDTRPRLIETFCSTVDALAASPPTR